jgi:hypothetical protein
MSTVQGVGTRFYGWKHHSDGTAHATQWFTLFYLPVVPLRRYGLRVLTDFAQKEPFMVVPSSGFFAGYPIGLQVDRFQLIERNPLAKGATWPLYLAAVLFAVTLGNAIAVPLIALRRTRGYHGRLFG